jgi:hypothetical protein
VTNSLIMQLETNAFGHSLLCVYIVLRLLTQDSAHLIMMTLRLIHFCCCCSSLVFLPSWQFLLFILFIPLSYNKCC